MFGAAAAAFGSFDSAETAMTLVWPTVATERVAGPTILATWSSSGWDCSTSTWVSTVCCWLIWNSDESGLALSTVFKLSAGPSTRSFALAW